MVVTFCLCRLWIIIVATLLWSCLLLGVSSMLRVGTHLNNVHVATINRQKQGDHSRVATMVVTICLCRLWTITDATLLWSCLLCTVHQCHVYM
jgi:hypothetical protein